MPIYEVNNGLLDPDSVPRRVMAVGGSIITDANGMELSPHSHRKGELIYMTRGLLKCEVPQGLWIVPPGCAVWIPGGTRHSVKGVGTIDVYILFVELGSRCHLPNTCCTVFVSPLLRELLLRCASFCALYPTKGAESRLAAVLLDELAAAPIEKLHLPMPDDDRLRRIADRMTSYPSDRAGVHEWAKRIGVSERTLNRLVVQKTGMSFGRWRQQLQIILALQWLVQGRSVKSVSIDLGYESTSNFVSMFRKALGSSPARYMSKRGLGDKGQPTVLRGKEMGALKQFHPRQSRRNP